MASQDYLIAIALIEQNNVRAMPLGGKEIKEKTERHDDANTSLRGRRDSLYSSC